MVYYYINLQKDLTCGLLRQCFVVVCQQHVLAETSGHYVSEYYEDAFNCSKWHMLFSTVAKLQSECMQERAQLTEVGKRAAIRICAMAANEQLRRQVRKNSRLELDSHSHSHAATRPRQFRAPFQASTRVTLKEDSFYGLRGRQPDSMQLLLLLLLRPNGKNAEAAAATWKICHVFARLLLAKFARPSAYPRFER